MKHSLRTLRPRRSILILAMLLCMATAPAQTSQRLNAGKASDYGMVYSLPLTAVDIYLQAELTESQPGEFHNYARRHMECHNRQHISDNRYIQLVHSGAVCCVHNA